jgi:hypothetical protein
MNKLTVEEMINQRILCLRGDQWGTLHHLTAALGQ